MTKKVVIICTSADKIGDPPEPTGCWAEEVVAPYRVWQKHGYSVTIASIKGGEVPMDEVSLAPPYATKEVEDFLLDDEAMKGLMESTPLSAISAADYDAFFLAGGHGTVVDFPNDPTLIALLEAAAAAGKVISAVCHGPEGLVNVKGPDGKPLVAGKCLTCFSDKEEYAVAKEKLVPFLLESKLRELGARYESAKDNWAPHVVADHKLVTGQNPASSAGVAKLVVEVLSS
ncbi:hypothetical protein HYH02_011940 [Chlamydomonas schloesseri]|uniref:DJ-1/PfpI domain-containing protein n=1 Tax=Chlamydomonas schloesseri TaxID=2026947 RepID=A0A835TCG9_9CHLO|nr:hypothetical protein HYH02_011940 [Chlamydomonas schloesseri]|eukprot:KAG2435440.1 hypothetical protein HYH02_011940 [Chlamydomonas schloesseri]